MYDKILICFCASMDNFRTQYERFHKILSSLVTVLKTKYIPDAPLVLQYVEFIPSVLPVNDPVLARGVVDSICQGVLDFVSLVMKVTDKIRPFVTDDFQGWLTEQKRSLRWDMWEVYLSCINLRMNESAKAGSHVVVSSGVGGVNPGVQSRVSTQNIAKLQDLLRVLDQIPNQPSFELA